MKSFSDFCFDFEFFDEGNVTIPISIGMVHVATGDSYYAVVGDIPAVDIYVKHEFLREAVWPLLPTGPDKVLLDWDHPDVKAREDIAEELRDFVYDHSVRLMTGQVRLWAWYAAWDMVCLGRLFGGMLNIPSPLPQFPHDLKVAYDASGLTRADLPVQDPATEHHALHDSHHDVAIGRALKAFAES